MATVDLDEVITMLKPCGFFADLDIDVLKLIAPLAVLRVIPEEGILFEQGSLRDSMFVSVKGRIRVERRHDLGVDKVLTLGPQNVLCDGSLVGASDNSTFARALTEVTVLEFAASDLLNALRQCPDAAILILTRVAQTVTRTLQFASPREMGRFMTYRTGTREEHDLLGSMQVPRNALYGIQTLRAIENFPITGIRINHFRYLVRALAMVKLAAAKTNRVLEPQFLPTVQADSIEIASQEIIDGLWHGHFVVDMVQGGAGTSTNMNANEVIANRSLELMGRNRGEYDFCHPLNHVNLSQSTNDVYPTAVRVAACMFVQKLTAALHLMKDALEKKAVEFANILKMGRTQLQDAVPMTLGQEFTAFAVTASEDIDMTGINTDTRYANMAVSNLREICGFDIELAHDLVHASPDTSCFVMFSGCLKSVAVKLSKMCNDLRLLSSGPRCGLFEIKLPPVQPGSSIMPGKVNPVIPEMVNQVAYQVIGNDLTITMAAEAGQFQLNAMEPIIVLNLFQSLEILTEGITILTTRCLSGIVPNAERCLHLVENSVGIVTALSPDLGHELAGEVAQEALKSGDKVVDIVRRRGLLDDSHLERLLSLKGMITPRPMASREG